MRTNKVAMTLTINSDESVSVDMGMAEFDPKKIPFLAEQTAPTYTLELPGEKTPQEQVEVSVLSMGNPHAVQRVADITNAPLARQGALIENHERFPQRVNAGFMQVISREHIRLRVHERGVGETLGCGSGACAAVIAGITLDLLDSRVTVSLPGGDAQVEWHGHGSAVLLRGSACTVFRGVIEL